MLGSLDMRENLRSRESESLESVSNYSARWTRMYALTYVSQKYLCL